MTSPSARIVYICVCLQSLAIGNRCVWFQETKRPWPISYFKRQQTTSAS